MTKKKNNTKTSRKKPTKQVVKPTTATKRKGKEKQLLNLISVLIKKHNDKNGGHPHIIVDNVDNKHVSVGLTTQSHKGTGPNAGKNYSLGNNPIDENAEHTYMRRQATVDNKSNYYNPITGKMTEKDYKKAKENGEKAKKKYLEEKEQKKE